MRKPILACLTAIGLLAASGAALAQTQSQTTTTTTTTRITPDQQRTIYTTITREQTAEVPPPPPNWTPQIGIEVPAQVQLREMPSTIDVPTVRTDRYTIVNGRVILVDPGTRRVIEVIDR